MMCFQTIPVRLATPLVLVFAAIPCLTAAQSDFSRAYSEQFRLNAPGLGVSRETLRANLNATHAGTGNLQSQGNSNMANVIQLTENYEIVLNGDNNNVTTQASKVNGTQDGTGVAQKANNLINTNSSLNAASAPGGNAQAGVTVLNP